jgi:hypothetical protein
VDVGYRRHSLTIGFPGGEVLEEFQIEHRLERFQDFFLRIEKHNRNKGYSAAVTMECYDGYARPINPGKTLISTDLAGFPRVANHQIGRHESDSLGSHPIKLIRQYLRTSRR